MWTGLVYRYPLTHDQLEPRLAFAESNPDRRRIWNAVVDGDVVGHIELTDIWQDIDRKAAVARVLIDPTRRGEGLGKQMVDRVLEHAFDDLDLHRVTLGAWAHNQAAIRTYESCGFRREGYQRECRRYGDGWWDSVDMAILQKEWRAMRSSTR